MERTLPAGFVRRGLKRPWPALRPATGTRLFALWMRAYGLRPAAALA